MLKNVYRRADLGVHADHLMSFKDQLRDDFIAYHTDYIIGDFSEGDIMWDVIHSKPGHATTNNESNNAAWRSTNIKYTFNDITTSMDADKAAFFPAAKAITEYYGDDCCNSGYSSIEPNSVIHRHTDIEGYSGEYVRIHIPLIVPEGDIFLEVGGDVVFWDDVFAFNNQTIHSAHNLSSSRRLIYLIDISRKRLGLPPGRQFDKIRDEDSYPPFMCRGYYA